MRAMSIMPDRYRYRPDLSGRASNAGRKNSTNVFVRVVVAAYLPHQSFFNTDFSPKKPDGNSYFSSQYVG